MDELETKNLDVNEELNNFQKIARNIKPSPGEIPSLPGIDIYGEITPLSGEIGGDHLIYVDFNKRFDMEARIQQAISRGATEKARKLEETRQKAGILVADVTGHSITDALVNAMLHKAFLVGISYELSLHGEITVDLFETINLRFCQSSSVEKYITMLYGEIHQYGEFRFISAGHPLPVVFSKEYDRLMKIGGDQMTIFPPIGTALTGSHVDSAKHSSMFWGKPRYEVNSMNIMGHGDFLLLFTDGFTDQQSGELDYISKGLEEHLRLVKFDSASEIVRSVKKDFQKMAGKPDDDTTLVVVRKI
jgi:serine phosphatase RsbU (regulator of sigma subunit)